MKHRNYDVIVAWAEGKTVQVRYGPNSHIWIDALPQKNAPNFNDEKVEWRIKPQPIIIKYCLALMRYKSEEYYTAVFRQDEYFLIEFINSENFAKWVSDWLELEVPE